MDAAIQLSDRRPTAIHARQQSEPRIEALVFVGGVEKAAEAIAVLNRRGDVLGVARVAKQLAEMCPVARDEIDRLTLDFGHPVDDGFGGNAA